MYIIGTSCRRGTATILGTIIFVGIMFTAVIPMLLVMRQADTLHEMRKHEMEILDEERKYEDLHVYVFKYDSSESLTLRVENWGGFSVNIVRIWINDACYLLEDFKVQPMNWLEGELTDFTPDPDTGYFIKIATDRGTVLSTASGSLYCDEFGNWETEIFKIFFIISDNQPAGWYDVDITYSGEHVPESPLHIHKSGLDSAYDFCDVLNAGTYHVKITKRNAEVIYNDDVIILWPNGPRSVTVSV